MWSRGGQDAASDGGEGDINSLLTVSQRAELLLLVSHAADAIGERVVTRAFAHKDPMTSTVDEVVRAPSQHPELEDSNDGDELASPDEEAARRDLRLDIVDPGSTPELDALQADVAERFDTWKLSVLERVGEKINTQAPGPAREPPQAAAEDSESAEHEPEAYTPREPASIATPLLHELAHNYRILLVRALLLLLISLQEYSSYSRTLLRIVCASLGVRHADFVEQERQVAELLVKTATASEMTAAKERQAREDKSSTSRKWKIGLASVAGGVLVGVTGGLAAPLLALGVGSVFGGIGLGATATAGYLGAMAASSVLVGGLFGGYGARMAGQHMARYAQEVKDFEFVPLHVNSRLHVTIAVTGWLGRHEAPASSWRVLDAAGDQYCLQWETEALQALGSALYTMAYSAAFGYVKSEIIQRTVFAAFMTAMWPMAFLKVAKLVDNPWAIGMRRADKAGCVLADAIMNRAQGERPVTLIGYSLGARVVRTCLLELSRRRNGASGLVENAYMMGTPAPATEHEWRRLRAMVSGRLVNVYSTKDYILGFLYRTNNVQYGVAGIQRIESVYGVENVDVSRIIDGHLRYRWMVGQILVEIGAEDLEPGLVDEALREGEKREEQEMERNADKSQDEVIFDLEQETSKLQLDESEAEAKQNPGAARTARASTEE